MKFSKAETKPNQETNVLTRPTLHLSRRQFIKLSSMSGFAIGVVGCAQETSEPVSDTQSKAEVKTPAPQIQATQQPVAFLQITEDGVITIQVNRLEFGQGTHTGLARILAEELDADWANVRAELSDAAEAYKDPLFGIQFTGGSSSIKNSYTQYRELGARARQMLLAAAAQQWGVSVDELSTDAGFVLGPGGARAGYGELAQAARQADIPVTVELKSINRFKLVGQGVERLDTRAKSNGQQRFGIDLMLPEARVVLIARPPTFGGKVVSFDAEEALAVAGVDGVMQVDLDLAASGVAVVAKGYWSAKVARDKLKIQWSDAETPLPDSAQIQTEFMQLLDEPGIVVEEADLSQMASATRVIKADFSFPYLAHAPMEPLNATINVTGSGDDRRVTVYSGTQFQTFDQLKVAEVIGVTPEQVTIHTQFAGGGFGRRATGNSDFLADTARCMNAWMANGRTEPLKLVWSREDDVRGGYYRPYTVHRAEIGLNEAGDVLGWQHRVVAASISKGTPLESFAIKNGVDGSAVEGIEGTPYNLPITLDVHHPPSAVPVLWWRSVGHTHTAFVMETLIDQIARETQQDPIALRRKWLADKPRELETLDLVVRESGYGGELPAGHAWGLAIHHSFDSVVAHAVDISIENNQPKVHKVTSAVHCNLAVNPKSVEAQIEGAVLMGLGTLLPGSEITLKDGRVQQSNFHDYTVARMADMPDIKVHIVPSSEPPTGVGEPGLPPIAPAVANAIYALTDEPVRSLPISLTAT